MRPGDAGGDGTMSAVQVNAGTATTSAAGGPSRARRIMARLTLVALPLVAVYAALIVFEALTTSFYNRQLDIAVYYSAAAALHANPAANIYDPAVLAQSAHQHAGCALWHDAGYLYTPLLAVLFEPLTALPCAQAIHVWMLGNLSLWALCIVLLVYWLHALLPQPRVAVRERLRLWLWLRGEPDTALLAATGVVVLSVLAWPVLQGLLMGQVDLLLLALLLCVPLLVRRERYVAAGMLLAFAAMLKLLPALLIVYYLARGRRRVVAGSMLGLALLSGAILLAVRPPVLVGAQGIFDSGSYVQASSDNEALVHAPAWLAVEFGAPANSPLAALAGWALLVLAALLCGAGLLLVWRGRRSVSATVRMNTDNVTELLGYGWALCAMLLLSPLVWLHYNTWLLLPYVLCAGYLLRSRGPVGERQSLALWLLLIVGMLLFLPWSLAVDGPTDAAGPYIAGIAVRPLLMLLHPTAVVALWLIAGWVAWRSQRDGMALAEQAESANPAPHHPLSQAEARQAEAQ